MPLLHAFPSCLGKQILAAHEYYTPRRILEVFSEVMGKPATFQQVPNEVYKSFLPAPVAQELFENMLLLQDPGYYGGAKLTEGPRPADGELTSWKEYVKANRNKWE